MESLEGYFYMLNQSSQKKKKLSIDLKINLS